MSTQWKAARKQIAAFKKYSKKAPATAPVKKGYLLTRDEIQKLLNQREDKPLDGIRIYFGAEMVDDFMTPTVIIVGCEKDEDGHYQDYNVPPKNLTTLNVGMNGDKSANGLPLLGETRPCPTMCSNANLLNS